MNSLINSKRSSLGTTSAGSAWCLKALHPAAEGLDVKGVPDADAFPCVVMEYETVVSIPAPSDVVAPQTWSCTLSVLPHPVQPLSWVAKGSGLASAYVPGGVVNPTLPGVGGIYSGYAKSFADLFASYRMLFTGVTIDLDAAGLNNQGSVIAIQQPLASERFNVSKFKADGTTLISNAHVDNYVYAVNFPGKSIAQMPGAFMGLAADGVYMPVKIDPLAPWVTTSRMNYLASAPDLSYVPSYTWENLSNYEIPAVAPDRGLTYPFLGSIEYGGLITQQGITGDTDSDNLVGGDLFIPFQQTNAGHIVFYNLSPSASLTCKIKWGIEGRVFATSTLAPAMHPSPMIDHLALEAYSDLAATLPWAYPSSYNSWEKILGVLKSAWTAARPYVTSALALTPHPLAQAAASVLSTTQGRSPRQSAPRKQGNNRTAGPPQKSRAKKR